MNATTPEKLADLPASASLVFKSLYHEGEMTRAELQGATHLGERTVRRALDTLIDLDLVNDRPDPGHPTRRIYYETWSN